MKKLVLIFTAGLFMTQAKSQNLKQAIAYTDNELFETSAQTFYKLIAAKPGDAELLYYMGENFYASDRSDSAAAYYDKGILANPSYALNYVGKAKLALNNGKDAEASALIAKAKELSNSKDAVLYYQIAEAYVSNGKQKDMTAAMEALAIAEKYDAKNLKVYVMKGDAQLILDNDGSKALTYYEKAAELDPNSPIPNVHMGALYEKARAFDLAFAEYENAIKKDSTFAPSYRYLGDLYYQYNRPAQATEYYEKYLRLAGNSFTAKVKYAKFLFLSKNYPKAIEVMQELLAIDPSLNILNRLMAYSYFETKEYAEGLMYIERFLENAPKSNNALIAEDYSYYGRLLSAAGDDSLAAMQLEKAIQMDTTMMDTYTELANSYKKAGKYDKAIDVAKLKIQRTKEPSLNDYFALGQFYYAQGTGSQDSVVKYTALHNADSIFGIVTQKVPDQIIAHYLRAKVNANMDPQTSLGLAKSHYEKVAELGSSDPVKNRAYLLESYYYLAYLNYVQKNDTEALLYIDKILEIDPAHVQAPKLKTLIEQRKK